MEATRRITLRRPVTTEPDALGQRATTYEDVPCYAKRKDAGGSEGVVAAVDVYRHRVLWWIRRYGATEGLTPKWELIGDDGKEYDILVVAEDDDETRGARRRWWRVTTELRGV